MNVEGRVFFKVLSSSSFFKLFFFFKGKRLWVLKYNMADKTSVHSPHENVFKLTLSPRSFYVFRKDRQCKFIFLLSPSLDPINIISVRALEAVKVAGETLQRSRRTSPAVGSYLQPWEGSGISAVNCNLFCGSSVEHSFRAPLSLEGLWNFAYLLSFSLPCSPKLYLRDTTCAQASGLFTDAKPVPDVQSLKRSAIVNGAKMTGQKNKGAWVE